jgi:hypothetical protein
MRLGRTIRVASLLAALLGCGCAAPPGADQGAAPGIKRQTDNLCMNDCLGTGGNRDFCQDRCTN